MSMKKEKILKGFRFAGAAAAALLLLFFCLHSDYYQNEDGTGSLFNQPENVRYSGFQPDFDDLYTAPQHPEREAEQNFGMDLVRGCAVCHLFSLLHLNADKYDIEFWELNKIALVLTFCFLYLVEILFLLFTGSIKISVILLAVPVAVLGIVNCFVTSFRGMAISAADLFSMGSAMSVASEYTYELDWYMFSEIFWTFAICAVSPEDKGLSLNEAAGPGWLCWQPGAWELEASFICAAGRPSWRITISDPEAFPTSFGINSTI